MGQANDKHQAPTNGIKLYARAVIVWDLTQRRAINEETIDINRDWVHNQVWINIIFKKVYILFKEDNGV